MLFGATTPGSLVQTIETPVARARSESGGTPRPRDDLDERYSPKVAAVVRAARRAEQRRDEEEARRSGGLGYDLPPSTPAEESFRHSGWREQRKKIRAGLVRTHTSPKTLEAWDCCGSAAYVLKHKESGNHRVAANYCHHRLCLPCQRARSRLIGGNVRKALTARHYLHVVLTLASGPQPLAQQIDRLYKSFRRLRASKLWKGRTAGGAAFLEITRNNEKGEWHPHLHILVEARFIPHKCLSSEWLRITGDSFVVWVSAVTDRNAAAAEVSKYVTKPLAPSLFGSDDALDEFICAIKGRRLCLTFGTWFKIRLSERPTKYDPAEWETVCKLEDLIARADQGELHAQFLLAHLADVIQCQARPPPAGQPRFDFPDPPRAPSAEPH